MIVTSNVTIFRNYFDVNDFNTKMLYKDAHGNVYEVKLPLKVAAD